MTFALSDDEQNGVSIAVNTILRIAFRVGDDEDWSATAAEWWNEQRDEFEGKTAQEMLADAPERVVRRALETMVDERSSQAVGIYVLPTEEGAPPRALFLIEIGPGVKAPVGGAAYLDGAWRYPDGSEVEDELADQITEHAESLGVEWDH